MRAANLDHLYAVMIRAGRSQAELDLETGNAVSPSILDDRARHALALLTRDTPSAAGTIGVIRRDLLATFQGTYRGEIRARVRGEVRP